MAGVTCYSIQTLSIYAKKHCFYSGIKLLVFTATRKHRGTEKGKGQVYSEVCEWVRVYWNEVFSLYTVVWKSVGHLPDFLFFCMFATL